MSGPFTDSPHIGGHLSQPIDKYACPNGHARSPSPWPGHCGACGTLYVAIASDDDGPKDAA